MKNFLFLFLILCYYSFAFTQTYYLTVNLKNGTKITYEVADISKIDFDKITSVEDAGKVSHLVKSFKLLQNYPNPFNPSTTIQYKLPRRGEVKVRIFNTNGQLIKTIVNQNQPSGLHKKVWNGQNESGHKVASGFYICAVEFENTVLTKKMILIK